jgi:hypothetical protein
MPEIVSLKRKNQQGLVGSSHPHAALQQPESDIGTKDPIP